jgi:hypothetical protein
MILERIVFVLLVMAATNVYSAGFVIENKTDRGLIYIIYTKVSEEAGVGAVAGGTVPSHSVRGPSTYYSSEIYRILVHYESDFDSEYLVDRWVKYPDQYYIQFITITEDFVRGKAYENRVDLQSP